MRFIEKWPEFVERQIFFGFMVILALYGPIFPVGRFSDKIDAKIFLLQPQFLPHIVGTSLRSQ
jgi:hypothetical protein